MRQMKPVMTLLAALAAGLAAPAAAQTVTVVEEWVTVETTASRYVSPLQQQAEQSAIAAYGPFRVIDDSTVALVGITDAASPAQFTAMLEAFPAIDTLEFVEAPGTHDDRANLALGRMIRERGIATRAQRGGSVRSGAVELFIAGTLREISPDSQFAVHGWMDDWGRGAEDYPPDAPEHRRYLEYYVEMGMNESQAREFYAMTNSVPFDDVLWLTGSEMRKWVGAGSQDAGQSEAVAAMAYLDFEPILQ
ncbi:alpha/beta hydrolase [Aurantiacibacter rhizosphaerae]|uniref:Alpha/beta hydrolase n=1 Tax=Aurantiacibacter rhizosphaerae TaxID=2691582 RepID=A0A844XB62_9SPHN|nr:alpha/beta hydrolase [Aurantiacibacter rhizosphaerae]MWV27019.1 alpha/beta hydrolase [Aurantiacibacter rhizosphaerae]